MKRRRHPGFDGTERLDRLPESAREFDVSIGDKGGRGPLFAEDDAVEDFRNLFCSIGRLAWSEFDHFRKSINDNEDHVVPL